MKHGFAWIRRATQQRLEASGKFGQGKRLGEVVVAAGAQATHPVVHRTECAQHQDRRLDAFAAQSLNDRQPIQSREHPIYHQYVPGSGARSRQPLGSIGRTVQYITTVVECCYNFLGGPIIVFNDKHFGQGCLRLLDRLRPDRSTSVWRHQPDGGSTSLVDR